MKPSSLSARLLMLSLAVAFAACQWRGTLYHHYQPVPDGWGRADTLTFTLPQLEAGGRYCLAVDVRYTDDFPYRSLWLEVSHNLADSTRFVTDTVECVLADRQGVPMGRGFASLYQQETPYYITRAGGSFSPVVRLTHCMSGAPLQGISDIGLRISTAE